MGNENVTNEQIFALLQHTSQNVQDIKQELAYYKEKVDELEAATQHLQTENIHLKQKIASQEEQLRRKNILIFGLPDKTEKSLEEVVLEFFNGRLNIKITPSDLDNFYRIGVSNKIRPILVKFVREISAQQVLKSAKKLKGSGISIAQDLTQERRVERKILYDFLKVAKEKNFTAKIEKNKLIVNKDEYTVETLTNLDKRTFLEPIVDKATLFPHNSAPPTPTVVNKDQESSEDEGVFQPVDLQEEDKQESRVSPEKTGQENGETRIKPKLRSLTTSSQTPTSTRTRAALGSKNQPPAKRGPQRR